MAIDLFRKLERAIRQDNLEKVCNIMRSKGISVNEKFGGIGNFLALSTPLLWAAEYNSLKAAKFLLENRADVNIKVIRNETALMRAAETNSYAVAELLIKKGADVNAIETIGTTALMVAVYNNSLDVARLLLEHGADVNAINKKGWKALMWAKQLGGEMLSLIEKYGEKE